MYCSPIGKSSTVLRPPCWYRRGIWGLSCSSILPGFILCHVYFKGFGEGRFRYGGFLLNRLAWIYPLHLAILAAVGGLAVIGRLAGLEVDPNIADLPSLPANLLLLHAWGFAQTAAFNHSSWPFWRL